jgi:hypothetical protein
VTNPNSYSSGAEPELKFRPIDLSEHYLYKIPKSEVLGKAKSTHYDQDEPEKNSTKNFGTVTIFKDHTVEIQEESETGNRKCIQNNEECEQWATVLGPRSCNKNQRKLIKRKNTFYFIYLSP